MPTRLHIIIQMGSIFVYYSHELNDTGTSKYLWYQIVNIVCFLYNVMKLQNVENKNLKYLIFIRPISRNVHITIIR